MDDYLLALQQGRLPLAGEEILGTEAARMERIWLGLRTDLGVGIAGIPTAARALVEDWRDRGLAEVSGDRIRLTAGGWLILDELAVSLDAALGEGRRALALPVRPGYT